VLPACCCIVATTASSDLLVREAGEDHEWLQEGIAEAIEPTTLLPRLVEHRGSAGAGEEDQTRIVDELLQVQTE
jgi:hypothetical protein